MNDSQSTTHPGTVWDIAQAAAEFSIPLPHNPREDSPRPLLFRRIPAARNRGVRLGSRGRSPHEEPLHRVQIAHDYYLSAFVVTREQWAAVFPLLLERAEETGKYISGAGIAESAARFPHHPAIHISWHAACVFCWLLNELAAFKQTALFKKGYRVCFPTEAEWEHACRGPGAASQPSPEYWNGDGHQALARVGWFRDNTGVISQSSLTYTNEGTHSVYDAVDRHKAENHSFGLYGMHGNVWEWCFDDWQPDAYRARADGAPDLAASSRNPSHPCFLHTDVQLRLGVVRGGAANCPAERCTVTHRQDEMRTVLEGPADLVGFRPCLALLSPP